MKQRERRGVLFFASFSVASEATHQHHLALPTRRAGRARVEVLPPGWWGWCEKAPWSCLQRSCLLGA